MTGSGKRRSPTARRRRHGVWVALALLLFVFGAPCLESALDPRGRLLLQARSLLLCDRDAGPRGCFRVACGCGRHDAGEVHLVTLDPALPARPPGLTLDRARRSQPPVTALPGSARAAEIDSPPPRPRFAWS